TAAWSCSVDLRPGGPLDWRQRFTLTYWQGRIARSPKEKRMKIWANSGDSHYFEPPDLYSSRLPTALAERMPRSRKSEDGTSETIYVDGKSFVRSLPRISIVKGKSGRTLMDDLRHAGDRDMNVRRKDLDEEGIWAELVYPSVGLWNSMIVDPVLVRE